MNKNVKPTDVEGLFKPKIDLASEQAGLTKQQKKKIKRKIKKQQQNNEPKEPFDA